MKDHEKSIKRVLAIETSCDDTSVALVRDDGWVEKLSSAHQDLVHEPFGGVVPEIASRSHSEALLPLIDLVLTQSHCHWKDVDGIVVTSRPGLVGSLLVGVVTAQTLSFSLDKPLIMVNHLEGHLMAGFLSDSEVTKVPQFDFPYLGLAVSGGHTHLYWVKDFGVYQVLGHTVDDAAGEAFDKFAQMAGLGFPGGVQVDRRSQQGDANRFTFPRAMIRENHYNWSFSGLKTSARQLLSSLSEEERRLNMPSLCASYQEAIVEVLITKLARAVSEFKIPRVLITGGVSANSRLRTKALEWGHEAGVQVVVPPLKYCTDNAAMIGYAGILRLNKGERSLVSESPSSRSLPHDFMGFM